MADILIVDDDSDLTDVVGAVISAEGHLARRAHQGQEELKSIYERSPDLITLDLEMPVLLLMVARALRGPWTPSGASTRP